MPDKLKWSRRPSMCGPYGNHLRETHRCKVYHTDCIRTGSSGNETRAPEADIYAEFTLDYDQPSIIGFHCGIQLRFPHVPTAYAPCHTVQIQAASLEDAIVAAKRETVNFLLTAIDYLMRELTTLKTDLQQ